LGKRAQKPIKSLEPFAVYFWGWLGGGTIARRAKSASFENWRTIIIVKVSYGSLYY
jgi:hypothetical protein